MIKHNINVWKLIHINLKFKINIVLAKVIYVVSLLNRDVELGFGTMSVLNVRYLITTCLYNLYERLYMLLMI
jgi:hypothetical protein